MEGAAMFLWVVVIGLVAFFVLVTVVESRRGTKAPFKGQDRHLNAPEKRGGLSGWGSGSNVS